MDLAVPLESDIEGDLGNTAHLALLHTSAYIHTCSVCLHTYSVYTHNLALLHTSAYIHTWSVCLHTYSAYTHIFTHTWLRYIHTYLHVYGHLDTTAHLALLQVQYTSLFFRCSKKKSLTL